MTSDWNIVSRVQRSYRRVRQEIYEWMNGKFSYTRKWKSWVRDGPDVSKECVVCFSDIEYSHSGKSKLKKAETNFQ